MSALETAPQGIEIWEQLQLFPSVPATVHVPDLTQVLFVDVKDPVGNSSDSSAS
jgi:hypothetical protein